MAITRRHFTRLAASLPLTAALPRVAFGAEKPNSNFGGVQVGVIVPYSYHDVADTSAPAILELLVRDGVSGVEMQSDIPEAYAGAPAPPQRQPAGKAYVRDDFPPARPAPTAEQQAVQLAFAESMTKWRLAQPMTKYEEIRAMYNKAGVNIYAFKLPLTSRMPDAEIDYAFKVGKALGANHLTMELSTDAALTQRVGTFASKHKMPMGYHYHLLASPTAWDVALSQSPYNGINLDAGHYVGAGNSDVVDFIKKHHDRITSMHIKDRKTKEHGSANTAWGDGETPLKEILQLMKKEHYKFPATVELEYTTPVGSTCEKEIVRCLAYAKNALV